MRHLTKLTVVILMSGLLAGCLQYENKRGVDVTWETTIEGKLETGKTTRRDILDLLGPPSQLIALEEETVLYYLFEHSEGDGVILILYNRMRINTNYDRAVFFFDENDVLTEYATYIHPTDEG